MKARFFRSRLLVVAVMIVVLSVAGYSYYEPYLWVPCRARLIVNGKSSSESQVWRRLSRPEYVFWLRGGWSLGPARDLWVFRPGLYSTNRDRCIVLPSTHFRRVGNCWLSDEKETMGVGIFRSKLENPIDPKTHFANGVLRFIAPNRDVMEIQGL